MYIELEFEWGEGKSMANFRERGFDFAFATRIFSGPTLEKEDRRVNWGEKRLIAIGTADEIYLTVVYTDRRRRAEGRYAGSFQRGRALVVNGKPTKKRSDGPEAPRRGQADLARLRRMAEEEIARTSPEELADLPEDFWDDAEVVAPQPKEAISLRVDRDVLEWFRAGGPRYQSRMNAVLRSYMTAMERRRRRRSSRAGRSDPTAQ